MRDIEASKRMVAKTPEQWFLRVMQKGYNLSPKMSESLLAETELCFQGNKKIKIGQQKVILVKRKEKHGRPIKELEKKEIIWTINAGLEDEQYLCKYGKTELRQKRIQRLLQEATEQNGIATQEDLARVLHVSVRTIKRDFSVMKQAGIELVTRGYDEGVGRGQTHKSEIIQRWMNGESYDQLVRNTGHSSSSIQRYIQKYMQVVELSKQGFEGDDIGRLAQIGRGLVTQYLLIYEEAKKEPATEKWIENQRKRIFYPVQRKRALKKGGI